MLYNRTTSCTGPNQEIPLPYCLFVSSTRLIFTGSSHWTVFGDSLQVRSHDLYKKLSCPSCLKSQSLNNRTTVLRVWSCVDRTTRVELSVREVWMLADSVIILLRSLIIFVRFRFPNLCVAVLSRDSVQQVMFSKVKHWRSWWLVTVKLLLVTHIKK